VNHVEYAPRALFRLENRRNRQTDGRTPDRYITRLPLDMASMINVQWKKASVQQTSTS